MRRTNWIGGLIVPLLLVAPLNVVQPQGKGHGKGQEKEHAAGKGKSGNAVKQPQQRTAKMKADVGGRDDRIHDAGKPQKGGIAHGRGPVKSTDELGGEVEPRGFHVLPASPKHGQRLAGRAIARATMRGVPTNDFVISPVGRNVYILNRSGALLVNLDEDRDLGRWRVVTERDRGKSGAPSFCRSGAGHPVWGRQWCIEKGFGLGDDQGFRWARAIDFQDVVLRRPVTTTNELIARDVLVGLLGDIAFNRLATHAVTLGLVDPLMGRWIGEPAGPSRVLLVTSGTRPVAEVVDLNRDDRADLLLVAVRP